MAKYLNFSTLVSSANFKNVQKVHIFIVTVELFPWQINQWWINFDLVGVFDYADGESDG